MREEPFSQAAAEGSSTDLDPGERLARANALIEAALRCDWQDAEMSCRRYWKNIVRDRRCQHLPT